MMTSSAGVGRTALARVASLIMVIPFAWAAAGCSEDSAPGAAAGGNADTGGTTATTDGSADAGAADGGAGAAGIQPPLDPDPAVVAIVESLGPNESAYLPQLSTTGPINAEMQSYDMHVRGPRRRDYSLKWVWAADRRRALFCGENAGVPHRFNDVWEYDLAANTWVLLYEPDADFNKLNSNTSQPYGTIVGGYLLTMKGGPFDPVHSWWQISYEPNMGALLWVMGNYNKCGYPDWSVPVWGKLWMFAYYPNKNRWEHFGVSNDSPPGQNASILEYLPGRNKVLWYTNSWKGSTTSLFDHTTAAWTEQVGEADIDGNPSCPSTEAVAAYAPDRDVVFAHRGDEGSTRVTYSYDVAAHEWSRLLSTTDAPVGHDAKGGMVYDPITKSPLINYNGLWSYSVGDNAWSVITPNGPAAPNGLMCFNLQYNVLMIDNSQGRIWVYRPKGGR
jgi:hypothetical protein